MQVTSGFFTLVGHQPTLGRDFTPNDELTGNDNVVVLSHGLWMRRFGGDPAIVGRPVRLSGRTFHIVGVLPEGFRHVGGTYRTYSHEESVDIWSVLPVPRGNRPGDRFSHYFNVVGRVRSGVSQSAMEADLKTTGQTVAKRYPAPNSPWSPRAVPLKDEIVGTSESALVSLSVAAAVVLLLACVNVAGLLLGRAIARGPGNRRPRRARRDPRQARSTTADRERRTGDARRRDRCGSVVSRDCAPRALRAGRHTAAPDDRCRRNRAGLHAARNDAECPSVRACACPAARAHRGRRHAEAGQPERCRRRTSTDAARARRDRSRAGVRPRGVERAPASKLHVHPQYAIRDSWLAAQSPRRWNSRRSAMERMLARLHFSPVRSKASARCRASARRDSDPTCRGPATTRTPDSRSSDGRSFATTSRKGGITSSRPATPRATGIPVIAGRDLTAADDASGAGGDTREREPREQVLVHAERCRRRACADLGS